MTKKKKVIIGFLLLISVAVTIFLIFRGRKNVNEKYLIEEVRKENIYQTVSATGDLKSNSEIILNFENSGRIGLINVRVGDEIAEGEVLASLSNDILEKQLEKAKISLDKTIADAGSNDDLINELKQAVDNSENYLEEVENLEDQKISSAETAFGDAEDYHNEAVEYYNRAVDEYGEDSVNAQSAKLTMKNAESAKNSAEQSLETAKKAKNLAIVSAENGFESAKKSLKTAESQYALDSRNAIVASARADYEIALNNLEKTSLKSPVNGVIAEINYEQGEVFGSSVGLGNFGKIISKDFVLEAMISESDVSKIKIGQNADLSFDSLSFDEKLKGELIEIEPGATIIQDVVYYKAKIKINEMDSRLKEGMSADVDVLVDKKDNVLVVTQSAIAYDDAGSFARVIDENGNIEKKKVQAGLEGDNGMVEIRSGLHEGEKIIVAEKAN